MSNIHTAISNAASHHSFTEEERERAVEFVCKLRYDQLQAFLREQRLPYNGIKEQLQERIKQRLADGHISYRDLVALLDQVCPWSKQHVFLYNGPVGEIDLWRDEEWVKARMEEGGVMRFLNQRIPLILPSTLAVSSVQYTSNVLRICAVERRDDWVFDETLTRPPVAEGGTEVHYRAYVHIVTRGLVTFEWDLVANNAMLQISQLESGNKYEVVEERFKSLIRGWFPIHSFVKLNLRKAVTLLDEMTANGNSPVRIQGIGYETIGGCKVTGKSATSKDSVRSEAAVATALDSVRASGIGDSCNVYWLPDVLDRDPDNCLTKEMHIEVVASKNRINFRRPNKEDDVRYVLRRLRELSA